MNSMVRLLLKSADNGGRCCQTMTSVNTLMFGNVNVYNRAPISTCDDCI